MNVYNLSKNMNCPKIRISPFLKNHNLLDEVLIINMDATILLLRQ